MIKQCDRSSIDRLIFLPTFVAFFLLETAAGCYENLAQRLRYSMGSVLLITLILLMGSMKKGLQNRGIARGHTAELKGLRARHTGVQERLCQLQQTRHGKCITTPVPPSGGVRRWRRRWAEFFAEFDGIVDAELETGMNHDRVRRLIIDTATAAVNGSAATSSSSPPPPPPPARRSSDSAGIIIAAEVYPSLTPPSHQLRQNRRPPMYLTYNERGMQVDLTEYRGDSK